MVVSSAWAEEVIDQRVKPVKTAKAVMNRDFVRMRPPDCKGQKSLVYPGC